MSSIIFEPTTQRRLTQIKARPPQSLLLVGVSGIGTLTAAQYIAGQQAIILQPHDAHGTHDPQTGAIRVKDIRTLAELTHGKSTKPQFVIIDDADRLTLPAQNAFLKLLEEPPRAVHFILTSHQPHQLLATIRSRVQTIRLQPPSNQQTITQLNTLRVTDHTKRRQLQFIASQRPAELARLATDEKRFDVVAQAMSQARIFITGTKRQRMVVSQTYHQDRAGALLLLECTMLIIQRQLRSQPSPQLLQHAQQCMQAYERLLAGGNVRLQLLACVIL